MIVGMRKNSGAGSHLISISKFFVSVQEFNLSPLPKPSLNFCFWKFSISLHSQLYVCFCFPTFSPNCEWNWVICRDMDGPRDCHTEWSKSEREKQILYINVYMWNIEKWYRWTYLQSRNTDTDVENKRMDTEGGRGCAMNWDIGIDIYTLLCIK